MTDNEVTFSVHDPLKDGTNTVTIRVAGDTLDEEALRTIFGQLSYAHHLDLTTVFQSEAPPAFAPLDFVARHLGCSEDYAAMLCRTGWLTAIRHYDSDEGKPDEARLRHAKETGAARGWDVSVPWEEVLEVAEYARSRGHLPTGYVLGPHADEHSRKRTPKSLDRPPAVAKLIRRVLEDAKEPDGRQSYLDTAEIHERVQARMDETHPGVIVRYRTVEGGIRHTINNYPHSIRTKTRLRDKKRVYGWRSEGWTISPDHKLRITSKSAQARNPNVPGFRGSTTGTCTCGWSVTFDLPRYKTGGEGRGTVAVRRAHHAHRDEVLRNG